MPAVSSATSSKYLDFFQEWHPGQGQRHNVRQGQGLKRQLPSNAASSCIGIGGGDDGLPALAVAQGQQSQQACQWQHGQTPFTYLHAGCVAAWRRMLIAGRLCVAIPRQCQFIDRWSHVSMLLFTVAFATDVGRWCDSCSATHALSAPGLLSLTCPVGPSSARQPRSQCRGITHKCSAQCSSFLD
eukprot:5502842-Alexandrium_andersonii.AAC.1